ncbi:hypothetical protein EJB05_28947, partial [Eragrostis curvula]
MAASHGGWREERDGQSLSHRILFLGQRGSFSVDDATRLGMAGCAYFVDRRPLYGGVWNKLPLKRCRVYKYSFHDDKAELVEQLPPQWNDMACMWITPLTCHCLNRVQFRHSQCTHTYFYEDIYANPTLRASSKTELTNSRDSQNHHGILLSTATSPTAESTTQ